MKLLTRLRAAAKTLLSQDGGTSRITRGQLGDTGWYYTKLAPTQVKSLLAGMRAGDLVAGYELFSEMQDTWHTLAKNLQQLREAVAAVSYNVVPAAADETSPAAAERAAFCRERLKEFNPDPVTDENGFEDFIYDLTDALVLGINVQEILWTQTAAGAGPRATVWVHPNQYALDPADGRLKLNADGDLRDFPPDKFLIATYKTRSGARAMNGLLRPLAWWWCAVQFGRDWVLRNAELFGQPFRDIEYDPTITPEDFARLEDMAKNAGSSSYILRPSGTRIQFIEAQKTGDAAPQAELLDRADRACDLMILWQTLTSSTGPTGGGSLALGEVHAGVLEARKQNIARWVANVISYQLFPAILRQNYGDDEDCPVCVAATAQPEDPKAKADRLAVVKQLVPIPTAWLYEQLDVPAPAAGEETIGGSAGPSPQSRVPGPESVAARAAPDVLARIDALVATADPTEFERGLTALQAELNRQKTELDPAQVALLEAALAVAMKGALHAGRG